MVNWQVLADEHHHVVHTVSVQKSIGCLGDTVKGSIFQVCFIIDGSNMLNSTGTMSVPILARKVSPYLEDELVELLPRSCFQSKVVACKRHVSRAIVVQSKSQCGWYHTTVG